MASVMTESVLTYRQLESNFVDWAKGQPGVRSAIVVGSRARQDHPADEWSDLDLIVFCTEPAAYAARSDWLHRLGEVWIAVLDQAGRDPEWLVMYASGLKADFLLAAADHSASIQELLPGSRYEAAAWRGLRVLLDKNAPHTSLSPSAGSPAPVAHPTQADFTTLIDVVLFDATRVAKFVRRGDLWRAKRTCDHDLKRRLLTLIEWHARAVYGPQHDTWYDGRFLAEWADPRVLEALPGTFAKYDRDDLWRGLYATLDLLRRVALEIAERWGYVYPATADDRITEWIRSVQRAAGAG